VLEGLERSAFNLALAEAEASDPHELAFVRAMYRRMVTDAHDSGASMDDI
jgi:hypothetical protein